MPGRAPPCRFADNGTMTSDRDAASAALGAFGAGEADAIAEVQERYGRFARDEAPGRSDVYEAWASGVERDDRAALLLSRIPATRRQPPLVFAITRLLGAPLGPFVPWARWLEAHIDAVVAESAQRGLQTNEPLRCAALLPALATIDGPLALLELGASAGLCLYPDRYSYRYSGERDAALDPVDGPSPVVLESELRGPRAGDTPLRMPEIVWRAGVDLAPLDATDAADRRFLTTLVWPGETGRAQRIDAALDIVAADPPRIVRGDVADPGVMDPLIASAPADATLVITTPGVLPYVPRARRERLVESLTRGAAVWITIDPPSLHGAWHTAVDGEQWRGFVLARDARPLADVDPLGGFVEWRAGE